MIAGAQPGQILAGKYRVERVLGEGGMGVVLAAHHLHLDKRVALKFLRPEVAANRELVARFSNEARSAGKIQSEHVARVLDVGVLDDGSRLREPQQPAARVRRRRRAHARTLDLRPIAWPLRRRSPRDGPWNAAELRPSADAEPLPPGALPRGSGGFQEHGARHDYPDHPRRPADDRRRELHRLRLRERRGQPFPARRAGRPEPRAPLPHERGPVPLPTARGLD